MVVVVFRAITHRRHVHNDEFVHQFWILRCKSHGGTSSHTVTEQDAASKVVFHDVAENVFRHEIIAHFRRVRAQSMIASIQQMSIQQRLREGQLIWTQGSYRTESMFRTHLTLYGRRNTSPISAGTKQTMQEDHVFELVRTLISKWSHHGFQVDGFRIPWRSSSHRALR